MAAAISPNERGPAAHHTWEVEVPPRCLWPQRLCSIWHSSVGLHPLWGTELCRGTMGCSLVVGLGGSG